MANAAAAADDVTKALATAQAASETQVTEGTKPTPGEGDPGATPDSFVEEDAAFEALIAEQARLDAEAAAKVKEGAKEGETAGSPGEVNEGDAATAAAKAKADPDAVAAAAAAATNKETQAFIALRKRASDLQAALLIREGENRALKAMLEPAKAAAGADGGQPPAGGEPTPTIEEVIAANEAEREALAEKVDKGLMTMVQYTKEINALARQERELVLAEAEALAQAAAAGSAPATDLALAEATNALIAEYPILAKLTTRAQLEPIHALAYMQLELEGNPITSDSPTETKRLRQRMADLAEQFFDPPAAAARKAKSAAAAADPAVAAAAAAAAAKPGAGNVRTLPTAEERAAKLALAAAMPPEVGKVGAGAPAGELTEAQIEAALSGTEDQRIAFMESHPQLIQKVMGPAFRV